MFSLLPVQQAGAGARPYCAVPFVMLCMIPRIIIYIVLPANPFHDKLGIWSFERILLYVNNYCKHTYLIFPAEMLPDSLPLPE